jgi:hypothetical protein
MNNCKSCKHAEWTLTKNGRPNPKKVGVCTWKKVVYVPLSHSMDPVTLSGGYIWRSHPKEKCPTFLPIES